MAYWVKISYEKNIFLIDLDRISAFASEPNKRITFWLPNSSQPIVLNPQNSPDSYTQVLEYLKKKITLTLKNEEWIVLDYDRSQWLMNLNSISSFAIASNGRITFWLPDSMKDMIINPQSNPTTYEKLIDFIKNKTGFIIS